jgi:hypothetical protein
MHTYICPAYAFHASPHIPRVRFLRAVHVHGNLLQAINNIGRTLLLLRKRAPDTTPTRLSDPRVRHPFLSQHNHWSSNESQESVDNRLRQFTWPIITSMWWVRSILSHGGPTHQCLTNIGEGYNLGGAGMPHTTPRPSQPTVIHFPPTGPAQF